VFALVRSVVGVIPLDFQTILLLIGIVWFLVFLVKLFRFVSMYFLRHPIDPKKFGEWAIVTGCTDGIGKAVAEELAMRGMKMILVSRNPQTLKAQADELGRKYNVEIKIVPVDFSGASDSKLFKAFEETVSGLDIGVLINNVGVSYDHAQYFGALTRDKIQQIINVNIFGTVWLTHMVLPGMQQRKRGAIVNVSSISATFREPLYAVYTGTKAFVDNFSFSLHYEYRQFGIRVQSQIPALVTSKLSKVRHSSFFCPAPATFAKSMMRQLGHGPALNIAYWPHFLQSLVALMPESWMGSFFLGRSKDILKRALKKAEMEGKSK